MGCFEDHLIAYKIQYFLNFGGLGAASPFLHVFGRQLGLSVVTVGWVFGLVPFVDMICKPLICSLADRHQATRLVFLSILLLADVALTSVIFVPPLPIAPDNVTSSHGGDGNATYNNGTSASGGVMEDLRHYQFWLYAVLVTVAWISVSTNQSMADGMTSKVVEQRGGDYGRQRLWGTVGLSTMSTLSGYLIQRTSVGGQPNYAIGFYMCGALMSLDVLLCIFFFRTPPQRVKRTQWREIAAVLHNRSVAMFALCCVTLGVCIGLLWNFQFWYLDDMAKAAGYGASSVQLLEGLTLLVKGLGCQIPLMFMSGAVLRRTGHQVAMSISMLALGLHFILYSQMVDPWHCLAVEPLAGVAVGLLYPAIASYASSIAPEGTLVTTQAAMAAAFDGLGVGVGTMASAQAFSRMGGANTFLAFGCMALVMAALFFVIFVCSSRSYSDAGLVTFSDDVTGGTPSQAALCPEGEDPLEVADC